LKNGRDSHYRLDVSSWPTPVGYVFRAKSDGKLPHHPKKLEQTSMASMKLSSESVRWLFLEGLVVVVSILLAFWVDAWWQGRQHRSQETVLLSSLLVELQSLQNDFQENAVYVAAMRDSIRELLQASARSDATLSDKEIDSLLADDTWYVSPRIVDVPVLESLISTGELATISNNELRREIGSLMVGLRDVRQDIQLDFDFGSSHLVPVLVRHTSLLQIWNLQAPMPGFPDVIDDFDPIPLDKTVSHREAIAKREVQNLLLVRDTSLKQLIGSQDQIAEQLANTVGLLEAELAR
jgi:hypothetical protein